MGRVMVRLPTHRMSVVVVLAALLAAPTGAVAGDEKTITGDLKKKSYSIGYQVGSDFGKQNVAIEPEVLIQGIRDALDGTRQLLSAEEQRKALIELVAPGWSEPQSPGWPDPAMPAGFERPRPTPDDVRLAG